MSGWPTIHAEVQASSPRTPFMDHETKGEENGHAYVQSP